MATRTTFDNGSPSSEAPDLLADLRPRRPLERHPCLLRKLENRLRAHRRNGPKHKHVFLWLFLVPLIALNAVCGIRLHNLALQRAHLKKDYGQMNSFKYGILSIDVWKSMIQKIVAERITEFKLTAEQQKIIEEEIRKVLNTLLTEAENVADESKGMVGKIKGRFAKSYIKDARKNVPRFAEAVNTRIQKPATMRKLKEMALKQFNVYAAATHSNPADVANLNRLLAENNARSVDEFNATVKLKVSRMDAEASTYTIVLVGTTLLFALMWGFLLKQKDLHRAFFGLSVAFAFILLLTSLSIPMMEIDARIKSVDLKLMGEHLTFNEQVVYYRSKSLLQLVTALMASGKADSIGVAVLILLFSILFPMAKLLTAELYLLGDKKIKNSKLVHFFAFKSGKWSMADVTVVAILMAYIGFESIVKNQLKNLSLRTNVVESITTDASSMQPGFILFTVFVLYSMALSEVLKRITGREADSDSQERLSAKTKSPASC